MIPWLVATPSVALAGLLLFMFLPMFMGNQKDSIIKEQLIQISSLEELLKDTKKNTVVATVKR